MALPFRLDEGIFLEDIQVLIPWGTPREQLREIAAPEVHVSSPGRVLYAWRDHHCLGGQKSILQAEFHDVAVYGQEIYQDRIFKYMAVYPVAFLDVDNPRKTYDETRAYLIDILGAPTCSIDYRASRGYPSTRWEYDAIKVELFIYDKNGDVFHLGISKHYDEEPG
ncbi:MAG: hypothetical protein BWY76_02491 [bacterium ADurb.Bin429]|nr:MAG: hypothetical protein BWY76_02491 [bacterium ADurb.Bin429]